MRESEHVKTSLYSTDELLLRNEGDIVNFLCLEITKTSRCFEVKNSTDLVESIVVTFTPTFAQPAENSSSWHLGDQTCNSPSNKCSRKSSLPT